MGGGNGIFRAAQQWRLLPLAAALTISTATAVSAQEDSGLIQGISIALMVFAVFALIYFIPSFVAFRRTHPNRWAILGINVVFGGTGIGWVGALVWACNAVHLSPTGGNGGESGLNIFANDPVNVKLDGTNLDVTVARDPVEQLHRLKTLLDAGAVSAEEYAALRKPLLDQLMK
jgi:hypothetical protein